MDDIHYFLEMAEKTAEHAIAYLRNAYADARSVEYNLRRDVKIVADKALERYILKSLSDVSSFPILSEEGGLISGMDMEEELMWIVDPLDGSLNFSRKIPFNCISIALWRKEAPVMGVVYDFNHQETFTGIVGLGAWLNGDPITPSCISKHSDAVLCTGFPVSSDFSTRGIESFISSVKEYKKVRLFGSAALSLAYVACGRADVYWEKSIKIWDVAAGIAIIRAAGGKVEWSLTSDDHILNVKAANSHLEI